jgi:hypothetical protein
MSEDMSRDVGTQTQETSYDTFRKQVELIITNVSYVLRDPSLGEEIEQAEKLFFAVRADDEIVEENIRPIDQNNFIFWLLLDYKLQTTDETPMERFLKSPESRLVPEEAREFAGKLAATKLGLYDVISVDAEKNLVSMRDLLTLGLVKVEDPQLVRLAHSPVFFGLRVMKVGDRNFAAGEMYFYPKEMQGRLLLFLKEQLIDPRALVPPTFKDLQKKKSYLFNHMQMLVRTQGEYMRRKSERTDEGMETHDETPDEASHEHEHTHPHSRQHTHPVKQEITIQEDNKPARAHFTVEDFTKVKGILDEIPLVSKQKEDENSAEYIWYKTSSGRDKGESSGLVKLSRRKVVIETEGIENLDAAKGLIIKALKSCAVYLYDELEKRRNT